MSRIEVTVDGDLCISSGRCVESAPGYFVFDGDELATVADGVEPPDEAALLRIARACPSEAITLRRDGEIVEL
jgi:ferredoxin